MNICECLSGKRVLVAEDNEMNAEILVDFLKEHGADVDVAENGIELLALFEGSECCYYDLVLTDNSMPRMTGTEAIAELRHIARGDGSRVPVIVISADHLAELKQKAERAGADRTLGKPYDFSLLCTQVRKLFEEKGDWKHRPTPWGEDA